MTNRKGVDPRTAPPMLSIQQRLEELARPKVRVIFERMGVITTQDTDGHPTYEHILKRIKARDLTMDLWGHLFPDEPWPGATYQLRHIEVVRRCSATVRVPINADDAWVKRTVMNDLDGWQTQDVEILLGPPEEEDTRSGYHVDGRWFLNAPVLG